MSETLPRGWANCTFEDVIAAMSNGIADKQNIEGKGFPVTRIETISLGTVNLEKIGFVNSLPLEKKNKFRMQNGDILFSHINSDIHLGKTAIYKETGVEIYHGCNLLRIRAEESVTTPEFLDYICKLLRMNGTFSLNAQHAVNQSSLNQKKIKSLKIPLAPIKEQQRITAKLDCLLAKVDACKKRLDKVPKIIKRFRQSVLADAVSGKLTEDWREKHPYVGNKHEIVKNKYSKFEIPDTWVFAKMDTLIDKIQAGRNFSCPEIPVNRKTIGLAKISAVTWGKFNPEETKTVVDKTKIRKEFFIQKDDFLISRANTIELVGASVIVDKIDFRIMISDKIWRVSFNYINKRFVNYFLKSFRGRFEIESRSTGNQQSMRNISQKAFRNIDIPLPPLEEQKEIVKQVDKLFAIAEKIETHCQKAKVKVDKLSQSVLVRAFCGELVSQDQNDQSAEFSLNRIRAERENLDANRKKGGRTPKKSSGRGKKSKAQINDSEAEPEPAAVEMVESIVDKEKDKKVKLWKQPVNQTDKRFEKTEVLKAYRKAIFHQSNLNENTLLRSVGQRLGVTRLSKQIRHELESYIRTAIRRKIIVRNGNGYDSETSTIHNYEEQYLINALKSLIRKGYEYQRSHVVENLAVYLGYDKVSDAFAQRMKTIFRLAIRRGELYRNGDYVRKL